MTCPGGRRVTFTYFIGVSLFLSQNLFYIQLTKKSITKISNQMRMLLSSILLLQTYFIFSQDFTITVLNKKSDPMPYAYILINNKPVEVSDTMGVAKIPVNLLKINDTISVSYLGAFPAKIIFDETIKNNNSYCFYLEESGYSLNEVVVSYQNYEKLFRKSVNIMPLLNYECNMDAKLAVKINFPGKVAYVGYGIIEAINDKSSPRYWAWFNPPIKYTTNIDTNAIWSSLNYHIHLALNLTNLSLWRWQIDNKLKSYYSYLGEQGNNKIFRIVYPKTFIGDFYYQIILYIDKNTKYIKSVEVEAFNDDPNGNLHKLSLKYNCELYNHKKPKKRTIYLPNDIHYIYQIINGSQYDLVISDVSIII